MTAISLAIAVAVGIAVAGLSQLGAVNVEDPRPSVPPAVTLEPLPTPSPDTTESPTPTPSATPEAEVWLYTLAEGDSLSGVAVRFGTTTEELLTLNPEYAENQNLVEAGAQLIVPCTPIATAEDRC